MRNPSKPSSTATFAATGILLFALLSGCSGGTEDATHPSGDAGASAEDASLKYAQCMRDNGYDMPDPDSSGGMQLSAEDASSSAFIAAEKACEEFSEAMAAGSSADDAKANEEMLAEFIAIAQCVRDKGHDLPDPSLKDGVMDYGPEWDQMGLEDTPFTIDMNECGMDAGEAGK